MQYATKCCDMHAAQLREAVPSYWLREAEFNNVAAFDTNLTRVAEHAGCMLPHVSCEQWETFSATHAGCKSDTHMKPVCECGT